MTDSPYVVPHNLLAHLGETPELLDDQLRVLSILADPRNHAYAGWNDEPELVHETLLNLCADDSFYGVHEIADLLYAHYRRTQTAADPLDPTRGQLSFALESSSDGEIISYSIGVCLGNAYDSHLTFSRDPACLGTRPGSYGWDSGGYYHFVEVDGQQQRVPGKPPELSPLRKAVAIAQSLDSDYHRALQQATGLLHELPVNNPNSTEGNPS